MQPFKTTHTVTIANGASLSDAALLGPCRLAAIKIPDTWTAAGLTFEGSIDGGVTYQPINSPFGEYTAVATQAQSTQVPPADFAAFDAIKVRSGTFGTPVNQGGARTLTLAVVPMF